MQAMRSLTISNMTRSGMFVFLLSSMLAGATLAQTKSTDPGVTVLESAKMASSHACKFKFTNRSARPISVIQVGQTMSEKGARAELEFRPTNWNSTDWPMDLSPTGWFESLGSIGPPATAATRYSLAWQAKTKADELPPGKNLELTLRMNVQEKIRCDQLHWSSWQIKDRSSREVARNQAADTPERRIEQEVHKVNSHLDQGRAMQKAQNCEWGVCEFEIIFLDSQDRIRKIVNWAEGERQGTSKSPVTLRSIWEWYYDTDGHPIFLLGRYEGGPESEWLQQHSIYIQDGRVLRSMMGESSAPPSNPFPPAPGYDVVASGRSKLDAARSWAESHNRKSP